MIKSITQFFIKHFSEEKEEVHQKGIEFATAALLIEVSRSDSDKADEEQTSIFAILKSLFECTDDELSGLVAIAEDAIEDAHDLYQFTRLMNEHYDYAGRKQLVTQLWRVAYADGRVDKFEEHIIRRIAGLLHVDNRDFIQAKITARD